MERGDGPKRRASEAFRGASRMVLLGEDSIRLVPRNRGNTLLLEAPAVQMEVARR